MGRFFDFLAIAAIASAVFALQPLHNATTYPDEQCAATRYQHKHRVFVFSDISNEPDDQMSLVRFLTYANEIDIQGFSLITSTWKNDGVSPSMMNVKLG